MRSRQIAAIAHPNDSTGWVRPLATLVVVVVVIVEQAKQGSGSGDRDRIGGVAELLLDIGGVGHGGKGEADAGGGHASERFTLPTFD